MAKINILDVLYSKPKSLMEVYFDNMWCPHWSNFLTQTDVDNLRFIATSKKYCGNMNFKYKVIDNIMRARGFTRFSGGTNRVVYRYLEDQSFLAKVAVDRVGMSDNPSEYNNQAMIKPYCTKMFHITPCGTVGFAERVLPITSVGEFKLISHDVYKILMNKIIGKYIIEDIGTMFYMNWGIRKGFGPILLDYPYIFELDGSKIFCQNKLPNGYCCGGEIDYDFGMNQLVCTRCGKIYNASDLKKDRAANNIIITKRGSVPMNVQIVKGGNVVAHNNSSNIITNPKYAANRFNRLQSSNTKMTVSIAKGGQIVKSTGSPIIKKEVSFDLPEPESEESQVEQVKVEGETVTTNENSTIVVSTVDEESLSEQQPINIPPVIKADDIEVSDKSDAVEQEAKEDTAPAMSVPPLYKANTTNRRRISIKSGFIDDKVDTGDY